MKGFHFVLFYSILIVIVGWSFSKNRQWNRPITREITNVKNGNNPIHQGGRDAEEDADPNHCICARLFPTDLFQLFLVIKDHIRAVQKWNAWHNFQQQTKDQSIIRWCKDYLLPTWWLEEGIFDCEGHF